jgi:hydrogenase maturation factor
MWDMKCVITPVITGDTERVTKVSKKFGNTNTNAINIFNKKKDIFRTSHIIWKVLQSAT